MASTRSPSPANGESTSTPTSPQLSPRSKIQALLATVNNADSDDESGGPINAAILSKPAKITDTELDSTRDAENDDDDEEEEIVRPRGRLAARMRANDSNTIKDTPIYIRNNATKSPSTQAQPTAPDTDDEEISALPRRRLTRPNRASTPETTANIEAPLSPGLFVTPAPETPTAHRQQAAESGSDDDLPKNLAKNERFLALVNRKRKERLAKEAEEEQKRKEREERMANQQPAESDIDDDVSDISDDDGGRRLTQGGSRPARKASKKALEEMNRETQRISRSLQLAHEAKTKKKISKASLFERFNFRTEAAPSNEKPPSSSRPTTPGSVQNTDVDMADAGATPPSSPPVAPKSFENPLVPSAAPDTIVEVDEDDELPSLEDALAQSNKDNKGKGKAIEAPADNTEIKKTAISKPRRQVRVKLPQIQANLVTIDSDEELEITQSKKGIMDKIFDKLPEKKAQEPMSMNVLRRLAHLSSPTRNSSRGPKGKPSMTPAELQMTLQQRARAQAKLERERRLELLRSKGITVQTEEERRREREQVEDIVARARQEAEEIMQREREDAKKARKEQKKSGENDPLAWGDSDDDSYEESVEDPAEIELSGSEEGGDDEMGDAEDEDEDEPAANPLFEDEAEDDGESEEERTPKAKTKLGSDDEADDELPAMKSRRSKKHVHIVSDDDDEDENDIEATPKPKNRQPNSPSAPNSGSPKIPTSVLRSATKTFIPGLPVPKAGPAGLGLTQIFAGTMDDSQAGAASGSPMEFMPTIDDFPDSQFSATAGQSQNNMILDSQNEDTQAHETETQGVQLHFTQSQVHGFDSLMQMDATQMSELIDPTQDGGFQDYSPLKQRFVEAPQSTVDTVLMNGTPDYEAVPDSPLVKRAGKLRRRGEKPVSFSTMTSTDLPGSPSAKPSAPQTDAEVDAKAAASAFKLMEKAARRKKRMQEKFDKKKSKATEMVEEQAEESEDEYAGLGGADGEDSSDEDEELVKEMIDDATGNDGDDAKLAGFFADRERAADAAQVDKLFRDITTGMLRKRRRGGGDNDFDLSDSDDGGEARRRMKRRQFAKMQKALFADERIGKIAENPRNAAFLKSIEDRNSDDEWDFDNNFADAAPDSGDSESQSQNQGQNTSAAEESIPDSQPENRERKRSHEEDHVARPPPNARRTKGGARPSSLTDVRRELSNLLDEPNGSAASIIPATDVGSDSEGEEHPTASSASANKENRRPDVAVVDRIKLKRDSSSVSANGSGAGRLAFAAPASTGGSFRVPALLRRATTNSLMSNSSSTSTSSGPGASATSSLGTTKPSAGLGEGGAVLKKTAGKRSGINYFARETERRAAVADAEKRREAKKWKGAEGRSKAVGGLFGGGKF
ncbi:MRC1-like domain-containing protein, partial [Hypoxylon trugodes]|uniref:MRC1-like domain-containing protein n=1 Tax=Hypoxylon trugodes TaxID=326681 RepID=UPI002197F753